MKVSSVFNRLFLIHMSCVAFCHLAFAESRTENLSHSKNTNKFISQSSYQKNISSEQHHIKSARVLLSQAINEETKSVEKSEHYAQVAFEKAKSEGNLDIQIECLYFLSKLSKRQDNLYSVQLYLTKAEPLLKKLNNSRLKFDVLLEIANVQDILKKYNESISYSDKAINIALTTQNSHWLYSGYRQKASTLKKSKRYDESLTVYLLAHKQSKSLNYKAQVQSISELGVIYKYLHDHQTRITVLNSGIKYIERLTDQSDLPQMLIHLAQAQRQVSAYADAIRNATKALNLTEVMANKELSADASIVLSRVYRRISSYDNALKYSQKAITINRQLGNINGLAAAKNATALIYNHLEQDDKAVELFQQVLRLPSDNINKKYTAAALRELGRYYYRSNNTEKGLTLSNQAFELYKKIGSTKGKASVKKTIGQLYQKIGDDQKAIEAFNSAITDSKLIGDKWSVAENLILLGQSTINTDIKSAKKSVLKALEISVAINSKRVTSHAYDALIEIERLNGHAIKVIEYTAKRNDARNEIRNDELRLKESNQLILSNSL